MKFGNVKQNKSSLLEWADFGGRVRSAESVLVFWAGGPFEFDLARAHL